MSEFFSKLDRAIAKQKDERELARETEKESQDFFGQVAARLAPVVEDYTRQLKERGIRVTSNSSASSVWMELRYRDGGHKTLSFRPDPNSGRLGFEEHFTDDDHKNYKSVSPGSYDEATWQDEIFVSRLEKLIEDFVFYAPRHGGL